MNRWKPVIPSEADAPFADNQVEFDMSPSELSKAKLYQMDIYRQQRRRNQQDARQAELAENRRLQEMLYGDEK